MAGGMQKRKRVTRDGEEEEQQEAVRQRMNEEVSDSEKEDDDEETASVDANDGMDEGEEADDGVDANENESGNAVGDDEDELSDYERKEKKAISDEERMPPRVHIDGIDYYKEAGYETPEFADYCFSDEDMKFFLGLSDDNSYSKQFMGRIKDVKVPKPNVITTEGDVLKNIDVFPLTKQEVEKVRNYYTYGDCMEKGDWIRALHPNNVTFELQTYGKSNTKIVMRVKGLGKKNSNIPTQIILPPSVVEKGLVTGIGYMGTDFKDKTQIVPQRSAFQVRLRRDGEYFPKNCKNLGFCELLFLFNCRLFWVFRKLAAFVIDNGLESGMGALLNGLDVGVKGFINSYKMKVKTAIFRRMLYCKKVATMLRLIKLPFSFVNNQNPFDEDETGNEYRGIKIKRNSFFWKDRSVPKPDTISLQEMYDCVKESKSPEWWKNRENEDMIVSFMRNNGFEKQKLKLMNGKGQVLHYDPKETNEKPVGNGTVIKTCFSLYIYVKPDSIGCRLDFGNYVSIISKGINRVGNKTYTVTPGAEDITFAPKKDEECANVVKQYKEQEHIEEDEMTYDDMD